LIVDDERATRPTNDNAKLRGQGLASISLSEKRNRCYLSFNPPPIPSALGAAAGRFRPAREIKNLEEIKTELEAL
jgi:hypothetical protein